MLITTRCEGVNTMLILTPKSSTFSVFHVVRRSSFSLTGWGSDRCHYRVVSASDIIKAMESHNGGGTTPTWPLRSPPAWTNTPSLERLQIFSKLPYSLAVYLGKHHTRLSVMSYIWHHQTQWGHMTWVTWLESRQCKDIQKLFQGKIVSIKMENLEETIPNWGVAVVFRMRSEDH